MQRVNYPKVQMHRIRYTKLSPTQISAKLAPVAATGPSCASAFTAVLVGKTLQINTDGGPSLSYVFKNKHKLTFSADGHARTEVSYGALALNDIVLVSHLVPGTRQGYNLVLDLESGLATVLEVWFSGYQDNREVQRHISYGYVQVQGKEAPQERHAMTNRLEGRGYHWQQDTGVRTFEFYPSVLYSSFVELTRYGGELCFCGPSDYIKLSDDELVGRALTWNYSPGLTSMHVYTTPHSFSWIIFLAGGAGGLEWSGPAQYVKLRDDLYLFNWLEEACNGTLGILVINMRTLHDCGIGYHCGKQGLSLSSIGAQARHAGSFDIRRFYGPKQA